MFRSIYNRLIAVSGSKKDDLITETKDELAVQKQTHQNQLVIQEQARDLVIENKKNFKKWTPNDKLCNEYNVASEAVGTSPSLVKKMKQHEEKIQIKQYELDKFLSKEDLTPFDRFEIVEYKKDILEEEAKVSTIQAKLDFAKRYANDPIFEEYAVYVMEAEKYIVDAELTGIMSANDILESRSVYIKIKSLSDSLKYGNKNQGKLDNLHLILQRFNTSEIHENSRGTNLKTFKDFFIEATDKTLYLFDEMDKTALGNQTDIRKSIKNSQNQMDTTEFEPAPFGTV